jgi:uncharacterized protein
MKEFKYDILIDRDDVCDREQEINALEQAAHHNKKIILLAPRRYGKTSIIKNVVSNKVKAAKPKRLVLFVDLMDVESLHSIAARFEHGITQSFAETFPVQSILKHFASFFRNLSLRIDIDPVTNSVGISFQKSTNNSRSNLQSILAGIIALSKKYQLMLILDEFQDIIFVPEAEAILRSALQQIKNAAVFIMGSKRHLMDRMINDSNAPLFHYGDEMNFSPIPEEKWLPYFKARFNPKKIIISKEVLSYLIERLCNVPNAICELGAWLLENYQNKKLEISDIEIALNDMVERKQSYVYRLQGFNNNEKLFLQAIAKQNFVLQPYSVFFLKQLNIAKSSIEKILVKFRDNGVLEYEIEKGWRLSDPILGHYLRRVIL